MEQDITETYIFNGNNVSTQSIKQKTEVRNLFSYKINVKRQTRNFRQGVFSLLKLIKKYDLKSCFYIKIWNSLTSLTENFLQCNLQIFCQKSIFNSFK